MLDAWRKFVAALDDATAPGSDDPGSERRGWKSWAAMWVWFLGATMAAGLIGAAVETVTSRSDVTVELLLLPYAMVAMLMLARFYRLVLQRGYGRWVGAVAVMLPLGLCALIAAQQDPALFHWVRRLTVAGLGVMLMTGLGYAAMDRWGFAAIRRPR
jgi:hypothetical protein